MPRRPLEAFPSGGRPHRRARAAAALALLLASLAGAAGAGGPSALEDLLWDLQVVPLEGEAAPGFTLEDLDGRRVSLDEFRGRPVFLYFWATW